MKIRLMGTQEELNAFQQAIKQIPGISILNQSKEYPNRGASQERRIYIECNLNTIYTPAEVVTNLLDIND